MGVPDMGVCCPAMKSPLKPLDVVVRSSRSFRCWKWSMLSPWSSRALGCKLAPLLPPFPRKTYVSERSTLPETNSSHLKNGSCNTTFLLGWPIFRGYVSFRKEYSDGQSLRTIFFPKILATHLEPLSFPCLTKNCTVRTLPQLEPPIILFQKGSNCMFSRGANCMISYIYIYTILGVWGTRKTYAGAPSRCWILTKSYIYIYTKPYS